MKKTTKITLVKSLSIGLMILTLIHTPSAFSALSSYDMVKYDALGNFQGLSEKAITIIKDSHAALLKRQEKFSKEFRQFEAIYHAAHLTRMLKGNMFLYGPPGGAKSLFLDWMLAHENNTPFKLQLNQMMTEQIFIGGQDYEAARKGLTVINLEDSLAMHTVAVIDEIDKGNPAVLGALLSLLNERAVFMGHQIFKSPLETISSTSNKNLFEIQEEFERNGQGSTADALLNRFTCITFVPNQLERKDRLALSEKNRIAKRDKRLQGPKAVEFEKIPLDWEGLRALADALFASNDVFDSVLDTFVEKMNKESKKLVKQHANDVPPYYPTAQYSERLREKLVDIVIMSLTLDFLTSPLAEKLDELVETLKNAKDNTFQLTPLSIWRVYSILTTVSYGETKLIRTSDDNGITIDFGSFLENLEGDNENIDKIVGYIRDERTNFKTNLEETWKEYKDALQSASSSLATFKCLPSQAKHLTDIEKMLLFYKTGKV